MKPTGPVLVGVVVGLIVVSMNNRVADEAAAGDEAAPAATSGGAGDNADAASDEETGSSTDDDGEDSGFPDTGGADVPDLPAGSTGGSVLTLTFDDGPHPEYTPQVLDMLAAHDATAVFCVVGEQASQHPDLVRRIVDEGHALCNHTYTHDAELSQRPADAIEKEIADTAAVIAQAAPDAPVPFFRQPAMYVTPEVAPVARENGLTILDWTLDPRDWERPSADTIIDRVLSNVQPGAVVLLHDGGGDRTQTVKALAQILVSLQASGYETVVPTTSVPDAS